MLQNYGCGVRVPLFRSQIGSWLQFADLAVLWIAGKWQRASFQGCNASFYNC
jgi:hypothetical protein